MAIPAGTVKTGDASELLAAFQRMAKESGYVLMEARLSSIAAGASGDEAEVHFVKRSLW